MCQNLKCRRRNNNKKTVKKVDILFFVEILIQFDNTIIAIYKSITLTSSLTTTHNSSTNLINMTTIARTHSARLLQGRWRNKKYRQTFALGSGTKRDDLELTQSFMRTLVNGKSVRHRNHAGILCLKRIIRTTTWSKHSMDYSIRTYASRYGYVYSPMDTRTTRKLNAAFKVKFIIEAFAHVPRGFWDTQHNRWTSTFENQEVLDKVDQKGASYGVYYRNALLYICGKDTHYHSASWFRTLINKEQ